MRLRKPLLRKSPIRTQALVAANTDDTAERAAEEENDCGRSVASGLGRPKIDPPVRRKAGELEPKDPEESRTKPECVTKHDTSRNLPPIQYAISKPLLIGTAASGQGSLSIEPLRWFRIWEGCEFANEAGMCKKTGRFQKSPCSANWLNRALAQARSTPRLRSTNAPIKRPQRADSSILKRLERIPTVRVRFRKGLRPGLAQPSTGWTNIFTGDEQR